MIVRCVSYASFIDTIALLVSHERFFLLLLESFALMKLSPLEVDRELYKITLDLWNGLRELMKVSGPSRGR